MQQQPGILHLTEHSMSTEIDSEMRGNGPNVIHHGLVKAIQAYRYPQVTPTQRDEQNLRKKEKQP